MTLTRRTALLGAAAGIAAATLPAVPALTAPAAATVGRRATIVLAPHQDDETIRLSAYIAYASDRGDDLALITATNGAGTKVRRQLGLSHEQIVTWRDREQAHAWDWLTGGRGGPITRLGFEDGRSTREAIRAALAERFASMDGTPELYVATWHHDRPGGYAPSPTAGDLHPDHVACVLAARDLARDGVVVRYARHPRTPGRGVKYAPTAHQALRIEGAVAAYRVVGQRSVAATFRAVSDVDGYSIVTR